MIFFDTESVGLRGPLVTIQWCYFSGQIYIRYIWETPVFSTLDLIESFTKETIVGFNLTHDWFVLNKWYNIFRQVEDKNDLPRPSEIRRLEAAGPKFNDLCLKPRRAIDLMLIARSGTFQYLAKHKPITISKIPITAIEKVI